MTDTTTTVADVEILDELPPIRRTPRKREQVYANIADLARQNPGKWVRLNAEPLQTSVVKTIRDGAWEEFPAGLFEAASRDNDEKGKGTVYVRFTGTAE